MPKRTASPDKMFLTAIVAAAVSMSVTLGARFLPDMRAQAGADYEYTEEEIEDKADALWNTFHMSCAQFQEHIENLERIIADSQPWESGRSLQNYMRYLPVYKRALDKYCDEQGAGGTQEAAAGATGYDYGSATTRTAGNAPVWEQTTPTSLPVSTATEAGYAGMGTAQQLPSNGYAPMPGMEQDAMRAAAPVQPGTAWSNPMQDPSVGMAPQVGGWQQSPMGMPPAMQDATVSAQQLQEQLDRQSVQIAELLRQNATLNDTIQRLLDQIAATQQQRPAAPQAAGAGSLEKTETPAVAQEEVQQESVGFFGGILRMLGW